MRCQDARSFVVHPTNGLAFRGMVKKKRPDQDQIADCMRLRVLWEQHLVKNPHDTQEKFAARVGMTQSAFSHYMRAHNSIGLEALMQFAEQLNVDPQQISPSLHAKFLAPYLERQSENLRTGWRAEGDNGGLLGREEVELIRSLRRLALKNQEDPDTLAARLRPVLNALVPAPSTDETPPWDAPESTAKTPIRRKSS